MKTSPIPTALQIEQLKTQLFHHLLRVRELIDAVPKGGDTTALVRDYGRIMRQHRRSVSLQPTPADAPLYHELVVYEQHLGQTQRMLTQAEVQALSQRLESRMRQLKEQSDQVTLPPSYTSATFRNALDHLHQRRRLKKGYFELQLLPLDASSVAEYERIQALLS